MSQYNYDNNAREIFRALLSDSDVMNGVGAVSFIRKNDKPARLFLRQGNVYGVDNPDVKFDLATRLTTSRLASPENIATIRKSRQSLEKLLDTIRSKEMVKSNDLTTITKEQFLGSIDNLFNWDRINVEWRAGEQYDGLTVPQVGLSKLIDIATNRHEHMESFAEDWGFQGVEDMLVAPYYVIGEVNPQDTSFDTINRIILTEEKNRSIDSLSKAAAVQPFVILQALIALEKNQLISFAKPEEKEVPVLETVEETTPEPAKIIPEKIIEDSKTQEKEAPQSEPEDVTETKEPAPKFPAKHVAADQPDKGTTQMTFPSNPTSSVDIFTLARQLKEGLAKQLADIDSADQRILDYNQEISSYQAKIASLQVKLEAEQAQKNDLLNQHTQAVQTVRGLSFDE